MKAPRETIWIVMPATLLFVWTTQAESVVSNAPARTGFRLDMTELPPVPAYVRFVPPAPLDRIQSFRNNPELLNAAREYCQKRQEAGLLQVPAITNGWVCETTAGFRYGDDRPSLAQIETVFGGRDPNRTVHPSLKGFSDARYRPTSTSSGAPRRTDQASIPAPVRPTDPNLPPSGTGSLRVVLGAWEYSHVFNSLHDVCGDDMNVSYERRNGQTALTFETGLEIVVDNASGRILEPSDLPPLSDAELAEATWRRMEESGDIAGWRTRFQKTDTSGAVLRRLGEIRLDEVLRIADRAFVAWSLLPDPPRHDGGTIRLVFWVDVRSCAILSEGVEINGASPASAERAK